MKILARLFFIVVGALALAFIFYKLIGPAGQWFELNWAKSDSDLGRIFMVALAVQAISVVAGGWLGDKAFRMWRQRRLDRQ